MTTIDRFEGEHRFLSNFHAAEVEMGGETYRTVEHAFQAAKTLDPVRRAEIRDAATPGRAKRLGRTVQLRPNWDGIRVEVMTELVRRKFSTDPLRGMLLATGDRELVEGNTWGDVWWGVCGGRGENHLGRILMRVRDELRS